MAIQGDSGHPLALPDDQFWLEQLIEAAIVDRIADAECKATMHKGGKRYAIARLLRRSAIAGVFESWAQYCAARERLPFNHFQRQQVAA